MHIFLVIHITINDIYFGGITYKLRTDSAHAKFVGWRSSLKFSRCRHAAAYLQKVSYVVYKYVMIYVPSFVETGQKHKQ